MTHPADNITHLREWIRALASELRKAHPACGIPGCGPCFLLLHADDLADSCAACDRMNARKGAKEEAPEVDPRQLPLVGEP